MTNNRTALIKIEERDGPASRAETAPLVAAVYPPEVMATIVWRDVVSAPASHKVVVYYDKQLVAAAGMLFREADVDGVPARIAGIGGVMTLPEAQGKGFGRAAMLAAHEIIERDGTSAFGLLFCEPKNIGFYERLGWLVFHGTVIAEQPDAIAAYRVMPAMVRPLAGQAPVDGTINLRGLPW
jgi:aminoglycoside 2'-N-acetyltransferase I